LQDVDRLRRRYYEVELEQFNLGQALSDILALAQTYQIRIPREYTLLAKTAVTVDGVVRKLDPHASLVNLGKPHAFELLWQRLAPGWWVPDAAETVMEWADVATRLPSQVDRALNTLSQGEFRIILEHKTLDKVLQHWERLVNRLALSFLLASLIVGTGLVVHRNQLDALTHFPLGEYAFIATLAMGLWVVVGAMRRGKL
jgi:ubiquinone biosynthesis protein